MELATKNVHCSAIEKAGAIATMAGATADMPATVSGEMRVCQRSGKHAQASQALPLAHGRLTADRHARSKRQRTWPKYHLKSLPPLADRVSSHVLSHYVKIRWRLQSTGTDTHLTVSQGVRGQGCPMVASMPHSCCCVGRARCMQSGVATRVLAAAAGAAAHQEPAWGLP